MNQSIKIILGIFIFTANLFSSPLDWRMYSNENSAWFCSSSEIQIFTPASRSLRPLTIDQTRLVNRLYDYVMYDGYLWVTSDAGIYKIDMNSLGAERIALPGDSIIEGHIAVDMDYVWVVTSQTLFKYDQLGQEWLQYSLPESSAVVNGIYSTGDEVFCICGQKLYRYTSSTEKWNIYKIEKEISQQAQLSPGSTSFKFIDGDFVKVYKPASYSWENISVGQTLVDYIDEDSVVFLCAGKRVQKMNSESGVVQPYDIPGIDTVYAIEKLADTIIVATGKRLIKYDTRTFGIEFIEYSPELKASELEKVVVQGNFVISVYASAFAIYDRENRGWQIISRSSLKKDIKRFSWDNDGLTIRYTPGFQSVLRGSVQERLIFNSKPFEHDTSIDVRRVDGKIVRDTTFDSTRVIGYKISKLPLMNLNLKTSDTHDRSLDVFINNTSVNTPPEKGIYYRGNRDDRLNNFRLGTTSNEQFSSMTLPEIKLEGVSAGVESKQRVEGRDRKIIKASAGSGFITSRTEWRTLPYRSDGLYTLMKKKKPASESATGDTIDLAEVSDSTENDSTTAKSDTLQIIPGTLRVWVDGVLLDSTYYTYYSMISKLQIDRNAPVDVASSITIQYKIQTLSEDGINDVEMVPTHDFGLLHFGSLTISPKDWISARVGFSGISRDTTVYPSGIRTVSPIVNVSTPIELRNEKPNLFLKLNPEYSFNSKTGKKAGSASLQSRIGNRAGLIFNGMFADNGYFTTDTLSYGYGAIRQQYDALISYDIKTELPLKYYQHFRNGENGTESRYSASAGTHFQGFPFFDVTLSRTNIDHHPVSDTVHTAFDSLWNTKDKIQLRLYETSSKFLEQLTHIKRISYDIAHSEYRRTFENTDWLGGRMTTADITLAPTNQVILNGNFYFSNDDNGKDLPSSIGRQTLVFQTIDAPKGVDLKAFYYINYGKYNLGDSCTDTINRTVDVILKPGMWHPALKWFSPRFALSNLLSGVFNTSQPGFGDLIIGNSAEKTTKKLIGINIFPSDAILFRNKNEFINADTSESFKTSNDLQIWLGTKNFWQAIWNYSSKNTVHNCTFKYDRVLTPWLRTSPGFSANYVNDSIGAKFDYGAKMEINLNLQDFSIIKTMSNSHIFKIGWARLNNRLKPTPTISYAFVLSLVLLPNIQIKNSEIFSFNDNMLSDFSSESSVLVNF